jgi:group I intron endonuclease
MSAGIYQIINIANGKIYVGSALSFQKRWWVHLCELRHNKHHNDHLQKAWNKYGASSFKFEILEVCQPEDLITIEQYYLDWLEPFEKPDQRGYNIAHSADAPARGRLCSAETKLKIKQARAKQIITEQHKEKTRISMLGSKNHFFGKHHTEETKIKIREKRAFQITTKETKLKMSEALTGEKHPMFGKHHTEEAKEKIRQANLGKLHTEETKAKIRQAGFDRHAKLRSLIEKA